VLGSSDRTTVPIKCRREKNREQIVPGRVTVKNRYPEKEVGVLAAPAGKRKKRGEGRRNTTNGKQAKKRGLTPAADYFQIFLSTRSGHPHNEGGRGGDAKGTQMKTKANSENRELCCQ